MNICATAIVCQNDFVCITCGTLICRTYDGIWQSLLRPQVHVQEQGVSITFFAQALTASWISSRDGDTTTHGTFRLTSTSKNELCCSDVVGRKRSLSTEKEFLEAYMFISTLMHVRYIVSTTLPTLTAEEFRGKRVLTTGTERTSACRNAQCTVDGET